MKHFIIEITYTASMDVISSITPLHREFLKKGYESGLLLMSGPQNPRQGGIVVARAASLQEIETFFANDPYALNRVATYRFIEFEPVLHNSILDSWMN
jgi:uncharacterized protein YciI